MQVIKVVKIKKRNGKIQEENAILSSLYPDTLYAPKSGTFWRITSRNNREPYQIFPKEDFKIFTMTDRGERTNKNPNYLAWEIMHDKKVPEGYIVYAKDSDVWNTVSDNIGVIEREEYKDVRDALANMKGALRFTVVKSGKFAVYFRYRGFKKKKVFADEFEAQLFKKGVMEESVRLLAKYCLSQ